MNNPNSVGLLGAPIAVELSTKPQRIIGGSVLPGDWISLDWELLQGPVPQEMSGAIGGGFIAHVVVTIGGDDMTPQPQKPTVYGRIPSKDVNDPINGIHIDPGFVFQVPDEAQIWIVSGFDVSARANVQLRRHHRPQRTEVLRNVSGEPLVYESTGELAYKQFPVFPPPIVWGPQEVHATYTNLPDPSMVDVGEYFIRFPANATDVIVPSGGRLEVSAYGIKNHLTGRLNELDTSFGVKVPVGYYGQGGFRPKTGGGPINNLTVYSRLG